MVPAVSRPLVFCLPLDITIADSKEEAIDLETKDLVDIKIFMDGSSHNSFVGASMVLYHMRNGTIGNPAKIL